MAGEPTVLVVEDEPAQREVLVYNIAAEGYLVQTAASGDEALLLVQEVPPDLVVLDWMLPGLSGIEVCRQLKAGRDTAAIPVIMLSARSEEVDKLRGLEIGADDYVTKPYSVAELLARLRTQMRRIRPASTSEALTYEDIRVDLAAHRVFREETEVALGPTEFRLLTTFMERPGRVWSREQLLDRVWGREIYVDSRTVDVHIGRLRKALRKAGEGDPIRTVRGAGYSLG
ncbi:MAG: phosphate regulon transcriptional regulator PhoB [Pseudomonadota bacterium]